MAVFLKDDCEGGYIVHAIDRYQVILAKELQWKVIIEVIMQTMYSLFCSLFSQFSTFNGARKARPIRSSSYRMAPNSHSVKFS